LLRHRLVMPTNADCLIIARPLSFSECFFRCLIFTDLCLLSIISLFLSATRQDVLVSAFFPWKSYYLRHFAIKMHLLRGKWARGTRKGNSVIDGLLFKCCIFGSVSTRVCAVAQTPWGTGGTCPSLLQVACEKENSKQGTRY